MDTERKFEELKDLLRASGVDVDASSDETPDGRPTTKIAEAALDDLMVPGGAASVWVSWSRSKQLSGECTEDAK